MRGKRLSEKEKVVRITISLKPEVVAKLDEIAKARKVSRSQQITGMTLMFDGMSNSKKFIVSLKEMMKENLK